MGRLLFLSLLLLWPRESFSEGTSELGLTQALREDSVLFVDIVDASRETFTWTGTGTVTVTNPNGTSLGTFASGVAITPTAGLNGSYRIDPNSDQTTTTAWGVTVNNPVSSGGRLFSRSWNFNADSFAESNSTSASFYGVVGGGSSGNTSVIELKLDGLAGFIFEILANDSGVDGVSPARSVTQTGNTVTSEHKLYLSPPTLSNYTSVTPTISAFLFAGTLEDGSASSVEGCNSIIPGTTTGTFSFSSDVEGVYRVICDLNGDGAFDFSSDDDLTLQGAAATGSNRITWNGRDNSGALVAAGEYDCLVSVSVGEFHYVGRDIETSYEGLRLFEVNSDGSRTPLRMFWNDSDVQSNDVLMPNGQFGLESSGADGIDSGSYSDAAQPNVNARSWGNFNAGGTSKGDLAYLDTFTFTEATESTTLKVLALSDAVTDSDGDGLTDIEEVCTYGTDRADCDTDDDCLCDGTEVETTGTDPLDVDSDDDGLQDGTEVGREGPEGEDTDTAVCIPDEDPSTTTDPLNPDTDSDACNDGTEDLDANGEVDFNDETDPNDPDTDGDRIADICLPETTVIQGGGLFFCSLDPSDDPSRPAPGSSSLFHFFMLLMAIVTLVKLRSRFMRHHKVFLMLASLFLMLGARRAEAVNVQSLRPVTVGTSGFRLFTSEVLPAGGFRGAMIVNWDQEPFEAATAGGVTPRLAGVVDQFLTSDFLFSYGANERLTLHLDIPVNLFHNIAPLFIPTRDKGGGDMGDLFLSGVVQVFDAEKTSHRLGLALVPYLTLPTGRESIHFGDESVTGGLMAAGDLQWKSNRIYLNSGARFRQERERISNLVAAHEFLFGVGFQRPVVKKWNFDAVAEVSGSTRFAKFFNERVTLPLEITVIGRKRWSGRHPWAVLAGGGIGLSDGYSTPDFRIIAGVSYNFWPRGEVVEAPEKPQFIGLREQIHFKTASWVILPRSYPILDEVAEKLRSHPEILEVQIEGHTDSRASDDYNLKLSQGRAESVLKYLAGKGIDPARLRAVGFGESQPIDSNETVEGRAKNRRTMIRILRLKGQWREVPVENKKSQEALYPDT